MYSSGQSTMKHLGKQNDTWVIFGVWLLINHMVNVTETLTDILKHYFLQANVGKFVKYVVKNHLKGGWIDRQTNETATVVDLISEIKTPIKTLILSHCVRFNPSGSLNLLIRIKRNFTLRSKLGL